MTTNRRHKRIVEVVNELEDAILRDTSKELLTSQDNEQLFKVDTVGRLKRKRGLGQERQRIEFDQRSRTEKHLLKRIQSQLTRKPVNKSESCVDSLDIWNLENDATHGTSKKSKVSSDLVLPGQSYNPSHRDHQNILAEAVALEIKRKESVEKYGNSTLEGENSLIIRADSLDGKATATVAAFDNDDDDEHENSDGTDNDMNDDEVSEASNIVTPKKKGLLTQAQRNKKRRRNLSTFQKHNEDKNKSLLESIDQLPKILNDLEAFDRRMQLRKAAEAAKKKSVPVAALSYDEAAEVPLSDELRGSLRLLLPKGAPLKGRLLSLRKTGQASPAPRKEGGQRAHHKPHAARKIIWHPKYKY